MLQQKDINIKAADKVHNTTQKLKKKQDIISVY
jgi:hypothetical protein